MSWHSWQNWRNELSGSALALALPSSCASFSSSSSSSSWSCFFLTFVAFVDFAGERVSFVGEDEEVPAGVAARVACCGSVFFFAFAGNFLDNFSESST